MVFSNKNFVYISLFAYMCYMLFTFHPSWFNLLIILDKECNLKTLHVIFSLYLLFYYSNSTTHWECHNRGPQWDVYPYSPQHHRSFGQPAHACWSSLKSRLLERNYICLYHSCKVMVCDWNQKFSTVSGYPNFIPRNVWKESNHFLCCVVLWTSETWYPTTTLHSITTQNTSTWIFTALKASNLAF